MPYSMPLFGAKLPRKFTIEYALHVGATEFSNAGLLTRGDAVLLSRSVGVHGKLGGGEFGCT